MADYFRKYKSNYSSTSNSFSTGSGETITPASVSGLPTDTEITLTFDRVDGAGASLGTKVERIIGTISGGNFVIRTSPSSCRGADGTTEQAHTSPFVEMIWNAKDWNDDVDWAIVEHNQAGGHKNITASSLTVNNTVTASNISASYVDIKTGGMIRDVNNNELIKFTQTASAVNEITITNAATGNNPTVSVTGGDTNIDLALTGKGTGGVTTKGKKRVTTITSSATPTINTDNCDVVTITTLAEAITSMTTNLSGTPSNFQTLIIRIKDNSSSRNITWGASFANRGATMPTATTAGKVHHVGFIYNTVTSTWDCVAAVTES